MSNVIEFPPMIKQQVFPTLKQANEYAHRWLKTEKYATSNIVPIDDQYIVTVFPHEDRISAAVANMRKEYKV